MNGRGAGHRKMLGSDRPGWHLWAPVALTLTLLTGCGGFAPGTPARPAGPALPWGLPAVSSATASAIPEPTGSPSTAPTPAPTAAPAAAAWSFRLLNAGLLTPVVGPDGSTYAATAPWGPTGQGKVYALDATGRVRTGWPFAPKGIAAFATPAISSDGTVYALGLAYGKHAPQAPDSNAAWIWALDPSGHVMPGWPQTVARSPFAGAGGLVVRPGGGVVYTEALVSGGSSGWRAVALDGNGRVPPGWPVALPGGLGCYARPCASTAVGADGTWYALVQLGQGPDAEIVALHPDGTPVRGWPVRVAGGEGFLLGAAGTVYAWGVDTNGVNPPAGLLKIVRTRFLEIGPNGQPAPGWPVTISGPASIPTVGADGTLYATTGGDAGQVERVLALGPDGAEHAGWPFTLPADLVVYPYGPNPGMPARATGPSAASDGLVYLPVYRAGETGAAAQALLAVTPAGQIAPGWPVWLPEGARFGFVGEFMMDSGGELVQPVFGRDGTVYVAVDLNTAVESHATGVVMALDRAGHQPSGWPLVPPAGSTGPTHVVGLGLDARGNLVTTAQTDGGTTTIVSVVPIP